MFSITKIVFFVFVCFHLLACSGSGSSNQPKPLSTPSPTLTTSPDPVASPSPASNPNPELTVLQGVFLDSAVEGLRFKTDTQSGTTDERGTFTYVEGEDVNFYLGDFLIGVAGGKAVLTRMALT